MSAEVQYMHTLFGKQFQETRLMHTASQRYMPGFKNLLVKILNLIHVSLRLLFFFWVGGREKKSLVQWQ